MRKLFYNAEHYPDPTAYVALVRIEQSERRVRRQRRNQPMPLVFICSPYAGDIQGNTERARGFCRFAVAQKCIPIAPHLLFPQFLDDSDPQQRELGLFFGLVLQSRCDEMWVFGDPITPGMKNEVEKAILREIPIRYFTDQCKEVTTP